MIAGHLPLPHIPYAPVPTGPDMVQPWLDGGVVFQGDSLAELASEIGVPAEALEQTAKRYNKLAAAGHDDDFDSSDRRLRAAASETTHWSIPTSARSVGPAVLRLQGGAR